MSDSIITISLVNSIFDTNISDSDLISKIKTTQIILKPKTFSELSEQIISDSKFGQNQIIGLFPNGKKIEINDGNYEENKDKISLYLGYKQDKSDITIPNEILIKLRSIDIPTDPKLVEKEEEKIKRTTSELSGQIGEVQNNLFSSFINDFDKDLNSSLNESLSNIVLRVSNRNIQKVEKLRSSVKLVSSKLFQRANSCIQMTQQNSKEIQNVKKILEKRKTKIIGNKDEKIPDIVEEEDVKNKDEPKVPVIPEEEDKTLKDVKKVPDIPEEEDVKIFEFCNSPISIEEKRPIFEIKNIKLKNNSNIKDYLSNTLVWLKEDKSHQDFNFAKEKSKNELAFGEGQSFPKQKEIDNLALNLCINEPKEQEYKMLLSIKDTQSNNIISKNPLEIIVKMKPLDEKEIWDNLKKLEFFDLISDNRDEINNKIKSENNNMSKIKMWVIKEIENKKLGKINELLEKYQKDFNNTTAADDEDKKRKVVIEKKLNEIEIKKWIEGNKKKIPEPAPAPDPDPASDARAEEIYNHLEEDLYVSNFLDKEDVIAKIKEFNYDYDKAKEWVEAEI